MEIFARFPFPGLNLWYAIRVPAEEGHPSSAWTKQISRAASNRCAWDASDGSLRNFAGKTHGRVTALIMQFYLLRCIFPGSLRRLIRCTGGGFRFPRPPVSGKGRKLLGKHGKSSALRMIALKREGWGYEKMASITVQVLDATGNKRQEVELPDNAPVNRIIAVLLDKMNLPKNGPDGQPLAYKFHHKRTGKQLQDSQSLASVGAVDGDIIRLQPEITAG